MLRVQQGMRGYLVSLGGLPTSKGHLETPAITFELYTVLLEKMDGLESGFDGIKSC